MWELLVAAQPLALEGPSVEVQHTPGLRLEVGVARHSGVAAALPRRLLTISTPTERKTSPSPHRMARAAIRVVCSDDERYRVMVVPGTLRGARADTARSRLNPCSPPASPHSQMRSSMVYGSSWGTFSSTLPTTKAARSSPRQVDQRPVEGAPDGPATGGDDDGLRYGIISEVDGAAARGAFWQPLLIQSVPTPSIRGEHRLPR